MGDHDLDLFHIGDYRPMTAGIAPGFSRAGPPRASSLTTTSGHLPVVLPGDRT